MTTLPGPRANQYVQIKFSVRARTLYKQAVQGPNFVPHNPARNKSGAQGSMNPGKMAIDRNNQNPLLRRKVLKWPHVSAITSLVSSPPIQITPQYKRPRKANMVSTKQIVKKNLLCVIFKRKDVGFWKNTDSNVIFEQTIQLYCFPHPHSNSWIDSRTH